MRRLVKKYSSLSGLLSSTKNSHSVWFESKLEMDFAMMLEYNPNVTHYIEQPCVVEYETDKTRTYTPDFLVFFENSAPWLCEIKPAEKIKKDFSVYKARFKAARDLAVMEGWEFKIFTEEYIRTTYLENIKFLNQYEKQYQDNQCSQMVLERIKVLGHTTIKEVLKSFEGANSTIKAKYIYALWCSIRFSDIGCDLNTKLSLNSEIWINEE